MGLAIALITAHDRFLWAFIEDDVLWLDLDDTLRLLVPLLVLVLCHGPAGNLDRVHRSGRFLEGPVGHVNMGGW